VAKWHAGGGGYTKKPGVRNKNRAPGPARGNGAEREKQKPGPWGNRKEIKGQNGNQRTGTSLVEEHKDLVKKKKNAMAKANLGSGGEREKQVNVEVPLKNSQTGDGTSQQRTKKSKGGKKRPIIRDPYTNSSKTKVGGAGLTPG